MNTLIANPFKFGDPVEGDYYLPRPQLSKAVTQFLRNHIHVVLIGPRRFGKTSFVWNLLKDFERQSYVCLFVDIFNITSHRDFLQQMLRAIRLKKSRVQEWMEAVPRLRPKISAEFDQNTGQPSFGFTFDMTSEKDIKETIQDLLAGLRKLGNKVIVALDEFQKITELEDGGWLEATLRTHMQQLKNVSFLFTGSRRGIIYDMLNNPARPLYRSCQPIEFPTFGPEFTNWTLKRFADVGISCNPQAIDRLRHLVQDTPNYVQTVCFHLVTQGKKTIDMPEVQAALELIVRQNGYAYQTLLSSLTLTQQRALRLAAIEEKRLFTKDLLIKYDIRSAPALASAFKALKEKGILDEESRGAVLFDDPLFAIWLRIMISM